jgi:hypothetical protein
MTRAFSTVISTATEGARRSAKDCLLRVIKNGVESLELVPEVERCWLEHGYSLRMRARCGRGGRRVGFRP